MKKILLIILIIGSFLSCKTRTVVERHDSIVVRNRIDTFKIYVKDSVSIRTSNDTIYQDRFSIVYRDKVTERTDTIRQNKEVPVEVEVVREVVPTWCWWLLGGVILLFLFFVIRIVLWIVKR